MSEGIAVHVQLLGSPRARVGKNWVPFLADKRFQLLAYLAYQGDWVSREQVAFLFWPDTDTQNAKTNLRGLLQRVRAFNWLGDLEASPHQLRWSVKNDVENFTNAIKLNDLSTAVSLYRGQLLLGHDADDVPEYNAWLEMARGQQRQVWRQAVFTHSEALALASRYDEAENFLTRLLEEDPEDEEALRAYMQVCAQAGHPSRAMNAYETFSRFLNDELGLKPTSSTELLRESLAAKMAGRHELSPLKPTITSYVRKNAVPVQMATKEGERPDALPRPVTSFIGREFELAEARHLLFNSECRLLTLVGVGGAGKTRLVIKLADDLKAEFTDGVYFVLLENVTTPALVVPSIARVLRLHQDQEAPLDKIVRFIGQKKVLLVLDNIEHLLESAPILSTLLQACPNLFVLITSRERVGLEEEWLLPIGGLGYPEGATLPEDALTYDAIQLFAERVKRLVPTFKVSEANVDALVKISRLVEGNPLAIELASVWVRAVPIEEVAQEIERDIDFLHSRSKFTSDRHQSIRAVFEHSWRLLSVEEQNVLRDLSVFEGGFQKDAAGVVAGASIATIAALIDKSLFRISMKGRYDRHPLVHTYTKEKLAKYPEGAKIKSKHADYFFALALDAEPNLVRRQQPYFLDRLTADHDNLRAALRWYIVNGNPEKALRLANALGQFWYSRGHLLEGKMWLEDALALDVEERTLLHARAYDWAGHLAFLRGDYKSADALLEKSLKLFDILGDANGAALALTHLGFSAIFRSDLKSIELLMPKAISIKATIDDDVSLAELTNLLAFVAFVKGDTLQGTALFEQSLSLFKAHGHADGEVMSLVNRCLFDISVGHYDLVGRTIGQLLPLHRQIRSPVHSNFALIACGCMALLRDQPIRAARLYGAAEALRDSTGLTLSVLVEKGSSKGRGYHDFMVALRSKLDKETLQEAWISGRAMSLDEALIYASQIEQ